MMGISSTTAPALDQLTDDPRSAVARIAINAK